MPDFIWPRSPNPDGGLEWVDTLTWAPPTAFTDEFGPHGGGYEDLADALGISSEGAKRHVAIVGCQHHLFDSDHFRCGELARAGAWTGRPVGELTRTFRPPAGAVATGLQVDDVQDGGQRKEGFATGDGAKMPAGAGIERELESWPTGSVVTTGRRPRRRQVDTVERGI
jgi:hypothetical protein